jgi:hypothetical protein
MRNTPKVAPHCRIHPHVALVCPSCLAGRNKGVTSTAKAKASKRNGRLGGRPKLPKHSPGCDAQTTGRYTKGCARCSYEEERAFRSWQKDNAPGFHDE